MIHDVCVLRTCYLWIFACVYWCSWDQLNRAYFKYIVDQVQRCPLTEDDKALDMVQEGLASLEIEYSKYIVPKTLPTFGPASYCSYCCTIRTLHSVRFIQCLAVQKLVMAGALCRSSYLSWVELLWNKHTVRVLSSRHHFSCLNWISFHLNKYQH
jgi:hypothetical protein